MGLNRLFAWLFSNGRNVVAETAEVFTENTEKGAQRRADYAQAALAQYAAEFQFERKGRFDRFMDGLNRLPRPMIVLATFALFASAMIDPLWFAERMQGLALVPEPLWWLAGTIVSFYFAGRFQIKSQEMRASLNRTSEMVPQVMSNIARIRELRHDSPGVADTGTDAKLAEEVIAVAPNSAVEAWAENRHA